MANIILTHCSTYDSSVTAPPREVVYGGSGYPSSHEKGLHFKLRSAVAFISGPLILFSIFFKRQLLIPGHIGTKKFPCPAVLGQEQQQKFRNKITTW